jgi:hypothetical protein
MENYLSICLNKKLPKDIIKKIIFYSKKKCYFCKKINTSLCSGDNFCEACIRIWNDSIYPLTEHIYGK